MVSFKSTVPAAAVIAFALASTATAQPIDSETLESRQIWGSALRQGSRVALQNTRTTVTRVRPPSAPLPPLQNPFTPKRVGAGMGIGKVGGTVLAKFAGKTAIGATVGAGALSAQAVDDHMAGDKREEDPKISARQFGALRTTAFRTMGQFRPNTVSNIVRPAFRQAPPPQAPIKSTISRFAGGAATGAVALVAGAGEFHGGNHGNVANDVLANHKEKREIFAETLERLVARYFADLDELQTRELAGDDLEERYLEDDELRARVIGALRTAATRGATTLMRTGARVAPVVGGGAVALGASAAGGYVEGNVQNWSPETVAKIKERPIHSLTTMYNLPKFPKMGRDLDDLEIRALLDSMQDELD